MKNLMLTTVAVFALAAAPALAGPSDDSVQAILDAHGIHLDAASLPEALKTEIYTNKDSGDVRVKAIIADGGWTEKKMVDGKTVWYVYAPEVDVDADELRGHVQVELAKYGYNVDVDKLSDMQVAKLFSIVHSSKGAPDGGMIEKVLN